MSDDHTAGTQVHSIPIDEYIEYRFSKIMPTLEQKLSIRSRKESSIIFASLAIIVAIVTVLLTTFIGEYQNITRISQQIEGIRHLSRDLQQRVDIVMDTTARFQSDVREIKNETQVLAIDVQKQADIVFRDLALNIEEIRDQVEKIEEGLKALEATKKKESVNE